MLFSSPIFIFAFLPLGYLINLKLPVRISNVFLIIVSLFFYAWGEPIYILLLLGSVTMNYFLTTIMMKNGGAGKKLIFTLCILMNLGLLVVFKYAGFLTQTANAAFAFNLAVPAIELPFGISFFTFQIMSYVIDLYKGEVNYQRSYTKLLLYISLFPHLVAGPIVKYKHIEPQLSDRTITVDKTARGVKRFVFGLSKKLLIANTFAAAADKIFAMPSDELNITLAWIGALSYLIQIFFDFSGYSDMAIGLAKIFGFDFLENFNYPYIASNIQDFWKRWHISLTSWFREYLYIPLGGNRKGKFRTALNRLIVFFFTGLWHGASFTFIVWGLFHGLFLTLETYGVLRFGRGKWKLLGHVYTLLVVTVGFVIFRADTLEQAWAVIFNLFAGFRFTQDTTVSVGLLLNPLLVLTFVFAVLFSTPIARTVGERLRESRFRTAAGFVSGVVSLGLYVLCMLNLSTSSYNPFIYFRF